MCGLLVRFYKGDFKNCLNIDTDKWYKASTKIIADCIVATIHISDKQSEVLVFESIEDLFNSFDIRYMRSEDLNY